MAMTIVYSLGIFVVMMPIVLGAKLLASFFMQYHDYTYIIGGFFMMVVGVFAFLGLKLPMPHLSYQQKGDSPDFVSSFMLGIFSGVTSACCAPVLIGVMALSSLTPNLLNAFGVGGAFVLGMVAPLYLTALFFSKKNLLEKPILKKKITEVALLGRIYPIFVSNIMGAAIFFVTGFAMAVLAAMGKVSMPSGDDSSTKAIGAVAMRVSEITNNIPFVNLIFALLVGILVWKVIRELSKNKKKKKHDESCCKE